MRKSNPTRSRPSAPARTVAPRRQAKSAAKTAVSSRSARGPGRPRKTAALPVVQPVPVATAVVVAMNDAARKRAESAIDQTHSAYHAQGGLKQTLGVLETQETGASSHIYGLATFASRQCQGAIEEALALFASMCTHAETKYKATWDIVNLKDELPIWSVFKSNINRGMRLGLDPCNWSTERAYRGAVAAKVREALLGKDEDRAKPGGARGEPAVIEAEVVGAAPRLEGKVTMAEVTEMLSETSILSGLQVLVSRLITESAYIRKGAEEQAREIIQSASDQLNQLIDRRRITDEATRSLIAA